VPPEKLKRGHVGGLIRKFTAGEIS